MINYTNEEILAKLSKMTVKEAVAFIESLDAELQKLIPKCDFPEDPECADDSYFTDFKSLPNFKTKGNHKLPFFRTGRWG